MMMPMKIICERALEALKQISFVVYNYILCIPSYIFSLSNDDRIVR